MTNTPPRFGFSSIVDLTRGSKFLCGGPLPWWLNEDVVESVAEQAVVTVYCPGAEPYAYEWTGPAGSACGRALMITAARCGMAARLDEVVDAKRVLTVMTFLLAAQRMEHAELASTKMLRASLPREMRERVLWSQPEVCSLAVGRHVWEINESNPPSERSALAQLREFVYSPWMNS